MKKITFVLLATLLLFGCSNDQNNNSMENQGEVDETYVNNEEKESKSFTLKPVHEFI